jgi:hypothetical protein
MPGTYTLDDVAQASPAKAMGQFSSADIAQPSVPSTGATDTEQPTHWLYATKDVLSDLLQGVGEGALQTVATVSRGLNKIPGIGETLAPKQGIDALRQIATPDNMTQKVGAGLEQAAEMFATGPEGKLSIPARVAAGALQGGVSTAVHEGGTTAGASPTDVAINTALGAAIPAVAEGIKAATNAKIARGMVNESMMATARDVTYGNPAKALLDEDIATPVTGDIEKFKDAIRNGSTLQGAADAAGGRIAAVSDKINELRPQLTGILVSAKGKIPATVVTDPIDDGIREIMSNRGITAQDAQSAINELLAIKQAALKVPAVPGATATSWAPLEANSLKGEIGQAVDWTGKERVGELVEPIKKEIYESLKDSVNKAAPAGKELNERLTNLYAAQSSINKLAGFEEVGRGRSLGGVIGPSWMGRAEALAGRFIPALSWLSPSVGAVVRSGAIPAITQSGGNQ